MFPDTGQRAGVCRLPTLRFLEHAWSLIAAAAGHANVAVVLGTERLADGALLASALVMNRDGSIAGFQDKVQLDPSEEGTYSFGSGRRVFQTGPLTFGIAICHEGWRYPETVRWAVRHGAHIVFHPHFHEAEPGGYVPRTFRRSRQFVPRESGFVPRRGKHLLIATVNVASDGSPTTSAVVRPGWHAAVLPAVRERRAAHRGHRCFKSHGPDGRAMQVGLKNRNGEGKAPVRRRIHYPAARGRASHPAASAKRYPAGRAASYGSDLVPDPCLQNRRPRVPLFRRMEAALLAVPGNCATPS